MRLETARLCLRPLRDSDLSALVELDSDPEVMRHINGGQRTPRDVYADVLLPRMLSHAITRPGTGFLVLEPRDGGELLGWAHLRTDIFETTWLEVGYRLKRAAWGQGLATEAARALIRHGLDALGVCVVSGRTVPENLASRRVLEKCGLRYAGDFDFPARGFSALQVPATPGVLYLLET